MIFGMEMEEMLVVGGENRAKERDDAPHMPESHIMPKYMSNTSLAQDRSFPPSSCS